MDWYAWLCRAGLHPDVALDYALLFARNELGAADVRHLDHDFLLSMGVAVAKHRLEILKLARKEPPSSSSSDGRKFAAVTTVLRPWRATRLLAAAAHRSARSALARLSASVSRSRRGRDDGDRGDRATTVAGLATPRLPSLPLLRHRGGFGGGGRVAHSSWSRLVASPVVTIPIRGGTGTKLPSPLPMLAAHGVVGKPVLITSSCAGGRWRSHAVRKLPAARCLVSRDVVFSCDEEDGDGRCDVEVVVVDGDGDGGGEEEEEVRWECMFQDLKPT